MSLDIGLFGCGTIGQEIARAIAENTVDARLVSIYDRHDEKVDTVRATGGGTASYVDDPTELAADVDLVVEAASQSAVREVAVPTLDAGTDLLLLSVGALADEDLRRDIFEAATGDGTLYAPSGSITGLDSIKAAAAADELASVSLTTTKPPEGLEGAPFIMENDINLESFEEAQVVFEGPATEAASAFPANINVALALSLAGIGPGRTTVRIIADPDEEDNVHHIEAEGGVGQIETTVRNVPSPTNPKTSYLAPLSAIQKIRGMTADVDVGT